MIIRDFYFAAWLIEKGFQYDIKNGKLSIEIDTETLAELKKSYISTDKARFDIIRNIIRKIHEEI